MIGVNLLTPSYLNFYFWTDDPLRWRGFLAHIVELHQNTVGPFTRRPITTFLVTEMNRLTGLTLWSSFLLTQGTLLAGAGYTLGKLSSQLKAKGERLSQALFFLSFPVLFSFATPNDAYDEPAQYLWLFLTLLFLQREKTKLFALCFFLALLARESSVAILLGFLLLDPAKHKGRFLKFALPITLYAAYYLYWPVEGDPNRFLYWQKNFANFRTAAETLVSWALALGPAGLALRLALRQRWITTADPWVKAFFWGLAVNTPIIFFSAYTKETRLLALPVIFLWPWAGYWTQRFLREAKEGNLFPAKKEVLAWGTCLIALAWFYHPPYRSAGAFRYYALSLAALALISAIYSRAVKSRGRATPG